MPESPNKLLNSGHGNLDVYKRQQEVEPEEKPGSENPEEEQKEESQEPIEEPTEEQQEITEKQESSVENGLEIPAENEEEILQEEVIPEEEYPDDFFIPYPNYSISTLADDDPPEGILHNYIIWKGQVIGADGSVSYVPPGDYEIRITPLMTSIASHTASLYVTIEGSGDGGELTEEDIEKIQQREKEYFPNENSGFPMLITAITGDPVDLLSGALNWSYRDLLIEGKEPLDFTRTYVSSMRNRDISGLGNGWTHTSVSYTHLDVYKRQLFGR